ncbi:MAG TPA: hypothetical protein VGL94_04995 [Ktedonobacteraceae bacterium]|jgi:histidyl-tRNA synthetase
MSERDTRKRRQVEKGIPSHDDQVATIARQIENQQRREALISFISDNDINNLQDKLIKYIAKRTNDNSISIEDRIYYTEENAKYELAFKAIRDSLEGKSPNERIETIQAHLKGGDDNIQKKIFN